MLNSQFKCKLDKKRHLPMCYMIFLITGHVNIVTPSFKKIILIFDK